MFTPHHKHLSLPAQVGEVTFFDVDTKEDAATLYVSGYIDTLMIAHQTDSYTHLLVGTRTLDTP